MKPRKNRVMLVGTTTSGKTTLCQRIAKDDMSYRKTQTVNVVGGFLLDTPGEFLEKVHRHSYLLVCSYEVDVVVFVQDPTKPSSLFPPNFHTLFQPKPCYGIITKIDIATKEQIETARKYLLLAGCKEIFLLSAVTNEGVKEFLTAMGHGDDE